MAGEAGIDGGGGEPAGLARERSVARTPDVAGVDAVGLGGGIPQLLERVAPVAEVHRGDRCENQSRFFLALGFRRMVALIRHRDRPGLG